MRPEIIVHFDLINKAKPLTNKFDRIQMYNILKKLKAKFKNMTISEPQDVSGGGKI